MEPEMQEHSGKTFTVQEQFDQIFSRHMERLIGTRYGIEGLPLNSTNVSGLILLMERENEIKNLSAADAERYTTATLGQELEEMGFDSDQDIKMILQEMIQKDYIHVANEGLIPQKPAVSMTLLIDKTFPKMPGMNLVAYFIQTMDEVHSKRKDLETAANQFDQMMQMQGVPLQRERRQSPNESSSPPGAQDRRQDPDAPSADGRQISSEDGLKSRNILGRQQVVDFSRTPHISTSSSKVLSSDVSKGNVEIRKVDFGRTVAAPSEPEKIESVQDEEIDSPAAQSPIEETDQAVPSEVDAAESPIEFDASLLPPLCASIEETAESAIEHQGDENRSDDQEKATAMEDTEDELHTAAEEEVIEKSDEDIEKTIAAFEEGLAMECPMCQQSKVQTEHTAKGKAYYKCSNKACSFISWGKPYHIPCPQCNNPFLVEASDKAEKSIFKCPRATCRYWQSPPWEIADNPPAKTDSASDASAKVATKSCKPRKKVVRRRRVRRKK